MDDFKHKGMTYMDNFSPYHCTSERHIARFTGNGASLALAIYGFAFHLSNKTGVFYASIPRLAAYLEADEKTVRKAIRLLEKTGFFELLRAVPGETRKYKPVRHPDWQRKHGGEKACIENGHCVEKLAMPWDDEELDKLGQSLHAISGGEYKPFPEFIKGMRNTGHSDKAIVEHFRRYIDDIDPALLPNWKNGFTKDFMKHLRAQPLREA
jgi:hypothetical protein